MIWGPGIWTAQPGLVAMDPSSHHQVTIWGPGIWIARPRELGDGPFLPPSGNDLEDSHLDRPAWTRGDELLAMIDKHVSSFHCEGGCHCALDKWWHDEVSDQV